LADINCYQPNGVCEFSTAGRPGTSSSTAGILYYSEISSRNNSLDVSRYHNSTSTVKYNVYEGHQWTSYDDEESWHDKMGFLSSRCLNGLMIWSLDEGTGESDALNALMGDISSLEMQNGGRLTEAQQKKIAHEFGAYTGQDCFVTTKCTDGSKDQLGTDQVCPSGYQSVATAHNPVHAPGQPTPDECSEGSFHHICCPRDAMPK
ncbi:hypothetical protein BGW36DRAFT_282432, partial [Talaromyces proteolyticus]